MTNAKHPNPLGLKLREDALVDIGGLYRCCVESINEWIAEAPKASVHPGEKFACRHCGGGLIVTKAGTVRWDSPFRTFEDE